METIACNLCGSRESRTLFTGRDLQYGMPGEFAVVKCSRCGLIYTQGRPDREEMRKFYPSDYSPYSAGRIATSIRIWMMKGSARRHLRRAIGSLGTRGVYVPDLKPGARVLEIGCGSGEFLYELSGRAWEVEGVENNPGAVEIARSRFGLKQIHRAELKEVGYPPGVFDAVFAWQTVEHLHDPKSALAEIFRILKPGGVFAFSIPNAGSWEFRVFEKYWYALNLPLHLYHFTPDTISILLKGVGFSSVEIKYQRYIRDILGSIGLLLDVKLPYLFDGWHISRFVMLVVTTLGFPLAAALAIFKQSSRMTIVAEKDPRA